MSSPIDPDDFFREKFETEEVMRKSIEEFFREHQQDLIASTSYGAYLSGEKADYDKLPETERPTFDDLFLTEIGKLQWIGLKILQALREQNKSLAIEDDDTTL